MMDAPTTEKNPFDVSDKIVAFKRQMAPRRSALHKAFGEVADHVKREADRIQADAAAGRQVVPEVPYVDIRDGKVSEATKAAIRRGFELHVREAAHAEAYAQAETIVTDDAREGIAALLAKRPPQFTGR